MKDEGIGRRADMYSAKHAFPRFLLLPDRGRRQISVTAGCVCRTRELALATGRHSLGCAKSAFIPDRARVSAKVARNLLFITLPGHRASGH